MFLSVTVLLPARRSAGDLRRISSIRSVNVPCSSLESAISESSIAPSEGAKSTGVGIVASIQ